MNYYNPYFYNFPIGMQTAKTGLLTRLLGGKAISFSGILNGTQRVLNIANQTIPLVKQVKPVFGNVKTMFKVMNEFKRNDKNDNLSKNNTFETTSTNNNINEFSQNTSGPVFFA